MSMNRIKTAQMKEAVTRIKIGDKKMAELSVNTTFFLVIFKMQISF